MSEKPFRPDGNPLHHGSRTETDGAGGASAVESAASQGLLKNLRKPPLSPQAHFPPEDSRAITLRNFLPFFPDMRGRKAVPRPLPGAPRPFVRLSARKQVLAHIPTAWVECVPCVATEHFRDAIERGGTEDRKSGPRREEKTSYQEEICPNKLIIKYNGALPIPSNGDIRV